jgi:23S rRNA pseudouridine1911/1915/1917 synthase
LQSLKVLYEDNHLLVVDKMPGWVTQGALPGERSVAQWATDYLKRKYQKPGNVYVGIVSRLDAFASGVLVLARTSKAASRLSSQIREQSTSKRYLAMIEAGQQLSPEWTTLSDYLRKNDTLHRVEVVQASTPTAQLAELQLRTIGAYGKYQVVEIRLLTGRKHQIRAQLAHLNLPIIGDRKYGSPVAWDHTIGLHCFLNEVEHPTLRKQLSFHSRPLHWLTQLGAQNYQRLVDVIDNLYPLIVPIPKSEL